MNTIFGGRNLRKYVSRHIPKPLKFLISKTRRIARIILGLPVPPPDVYKQLVLKQYQEKYQYSCLIETGTYLGEMVAAQKSNFKKIYSIELGRHLYQSAAEKFKDDLHISIIHGDSGNVLPSLMQHIEEPSIFWLDGHYSGGITAKGEKECPIFEELSAIFNSKKLSHVILIDDARCFDGRGDYPNIDTLIGYIKENRPDYQVTVESDIIRCVELTGSIQS